MEIEKWREYLSEILKVKIENIEAIYQIGSRVYGTATIDSDYDLVVLIKNENYTKDLIEKEKLSLQIYSTDLFKLKCTIQFYL